MVSEAYVPILDAGQGKAKAILSFSKVHAASLFSFQPNFAWISFASEQQHSPTFYQTSHQQAWTWSSLPSFDKCIHTPSEGSKNVSQKVPNAACREQISKYQVYLTTLNLCSFQHIFSYFQISRKSLCAHPSTRKDLDFKGLHYTEFKFNYPSSEEFQLTKLPKLCFPWHQSKDKIQNAKEDAFFFFFAVQSNTTRKSPFTKPEPSAHCLFCIGIWTTRNTCPYMCAKWNGHFTALVAGCNDSSLSSWLQLALHFLQQPLEQQLWHPHPSLY